MLLWCLTSGLLCAKFSAIAALCSSIRQKKKSCIFVPEGFGLPELGWSSAADMVEVNT